MNAIFLGKGRPPQTFFGIRILGSLGYRTVKKIAEIFNRLSRAHQRHRQTDRRQTDGIAIAYSERNVVTFAVKSVVFVHVVVYIATLFRQNYLRSTGPIFTKVLPYC